jgi:hypothetical protein
VFDVLVNVNVVQEPVPAKRSEVTREISAMFNRLIDLASMITLFDGAVLNVTVLPAT